MLGLASLKTPASTPAVRTPPQRVAVCRAASREAGEAGVTGDGGDKEMRGPSLARRSVLAAGAALFPCEWMLPAAGGRAPSPPRRCAAAVGVKSLNLAASRAPAAVVCPVCNPAKAEVWGYGYENGPPRWRGFCVEGVNQSPIDIRTALLRTPVTQDPPKIITKYQATKASCINTGHGTMQVNFPPGSNSMVVGDTQARTRGPERPSPARGDRPKVGLIRMCDRDGASRGTRRSAQAHVFVKWHYICNSRGFFPNMPQIARAFPSN